MLSAVEKAERRKKRTRYRVRCAAYDKPRLSVYRSSQHIYVQIIDDIHRKTLISASTLERGYRESHGQGNTVQAAKIIGKIIAERASQAKITHVVFDRGSTKYHGRVKALAEEARQHGLIF